jgi:cytochrome P450
LEAEHSVAHEKWFKEYGHVIQYPMFLGIRRVCPYDARAINHILMHSSRYHKPEMLRGELGSILGQGLLNAEGEMHRRQRKIMNPAFSPAHIRDVTPIFLDKALELRELFLHKVSESDHSTGAQIDVMSWLTRMTLDVIGIAGFDYQFEALTDKKNELSEAFAMMFSPTSIRLWAILRAVIPAFRLLPRFGGRQGTGIDRSRKTMRRIGMELINEKKRAIMESTKGNVGKNNIRGVDLLTLLIKANMAEDLKPEYRLTDEEVLSQISTFIIAGHETTSTTVAWCLYALCLHPEIQEKLRAELVAVPTNHPTMDELNALPYLDAVIREVMRVYATVGSTVREATKDDIIPLSKPFVDRNGVKHESLRITKGTTFFIPIIAMNRNEELWGPDAREFKPERWLSPLPEQTADIPNVWGNVLSFLAGPRACIGYRFAVMEMKSIIFTLLRGIRFEFPDPAPEIEKKSVIVTRPQIKGKKELGMPLVLKSL